MRTFTKYAAAIVITAMITTSLVAHPSENAQLEKRRIELLKELQIDPSLCSGNCESEWNTLVQAGVDLQSAQQTYSDAYSIWMACESMSRTK